ncbi:lysylphosphatidylglycerol synthase domain-containing protein [Lewinella sp. IMCC34183]|uniref:lysylphosphatidylglycerol synthase domain-containing protein n=1 Tax=Lewinella sp. IMCC34183 TaxID=2248762 RepID=UPI000E27C71F|nr:lysylphosphatidylglycerol synthase domain-containing protein [Lewinella sp. IMCC34183]
MPRSVHIRWWLRLLAVVVLGIFAYQFVGLSRQLDRDAFVAAVARPGNGRVLLLVLALMPLNWLLEARKWQLLLDAFVRWPYRRVLRATLAGVSVSAATPNRVGEIGGRLLLARRAEWEAVTASTLLGSLCQWVAFLLLAWPALVLTVGALPGVLDGIPLWLLLPVGPLLLLGVGLGGKPFARWLLQWVKKRFGRDVDALRTALQNVTITLIFRSSLYACLRFGVYCMQLYLLLWFFGLELPLGKGLAGIAAIYLVQAGIPLPPGLNLVTRTELGLLLWSANPEDAVAVLAAYTALFGVNVLLPSIPGYWFIVRTNKLA